MPFDREMVRRFARGLDEIVVVEEKNPTLEGLIKEVLYDTAERPRIVGKHDEHRRRAVARVRPDGRRRHRGRAAVTAGPSPRRPAHPAARASASRSARCCPWRRSAPRSSAPAAPTTGAPRSPRARSSGAGTGCHGMSLLMDPALVGDTFGITAMGNEGAHWIGMSPFVETEHVVQNFGDGTYFHSGQLAVQAAIGAGARITFKILYNDTVAMTGGQDATFSVGVPALASTLLALGREAGRRHRVRRQGLRPDRACPARSRSATATTSSRSRPSSPRSTASPSSSTTSPAPPSSVVAASAGRSRHPPPGSPSTRASARAAATAVRCPTACRCSRWTPRWAAGPASTRTRATSTSPAPRATAPRSWRSSWTPPSRATPVSTVVPVPVPTTVPTVWCRGTCPRRPSPDDR